jgi:hypothetical protein
VATPRFHRWHHTGEAEGRDAAAKKFDANKFIGMRLTPDMLPFERQIQIATDHVKGCLARLAGQKPPKWSDEEKTLEELRARIRKALEFAATIKPAQLEGAESREIVLPAPRGPLKMSGERFPETSLPEPENAA